jgi:chorismate-pyruvate lyase
VQKKKDTGKGTRNTLTAAEKKAICDLAQANPSWSHDDIAAKATEQLGKDKAIGRSSVTKILKQATVWVEKAENAILAKKARQRSGKHDKLEEALEIWLRQVRLKHLLMLAQLTPLETVCSVKVTAQRN